MSDDQDSYSDEEIERRMNAALKRALNTPPKRHEEMKLGKSRGKRGAASGLATSKGRRSRSISMGHRPKTNEGS
jgi:hypothetical protein